MQKPHLLIHLLLAVVILIAASLRLYHLQWDQGIFPHPDERSTLLFYAPTIRFPEERLGLQDQVSFLDPRQSPLNPFWNIERQEPRPYTYGHFPLYLLVFTSYVLHNFTPVVSDLSTSPDLIKFFAQAKTGIGYAVVGRGLVAILDTISVLIVFLIARRLYGPWAGLLASALSAVAVLHIQLAHFFAVDPISTTFTLLTVYASILIYEQRSLKSAILAGIAIGLAVSSKYSALPVLLAPAMAAWFIITGSPREAGQLTERQKESSDTQSDDQPSHTRLSAETRINLALSLLALTVIISFITFAITSPFVLLDYENFQRAVLEEQGNMVRGLVDMPFTRQYRNTSAYIYFIEQQIRWGLGWSLGILALLGSVWAIIQAFQGKLEPGGWIILAWLVPYFGVTGTFLAKFMRYMSPVTPFAIILGVGLLVAIGRHISRSLAVGLGLFILLITAVWSGLFVNGVYATEHTWVTASRWIYQHVPEKSCIAREHWEEGVPMSLQEPGLAAHQKGYFQPLMPMYEPDSEAKYRTLRDTLRQCDYLVIASNRMSRTLPNLPERYPMSARYYQALFAEELGYDLVAEFSTPPRWEDFIVDDQSADESFTVYDHPKAYIFQKQRDLSDQKWFDILGHTWQGADHNYLGKPTIWMRFDQRFRNMPQPHTQDEERFETWLNPPLNEKPTASDWHWNTLAQQNTVVAIIYWWLAVQVIAWLTWPLTYCLFRQLHTRGYLLSKSIGLLLLSYIIWLLASLNIPANQLSTILYILILILGINLTLLARHRQSMLKWLKRHWTYLVLGEVIFTAVYLLFVSYRLINPDLWQPWHGGEKMLEIGYLNAIVKSSTMPPYDPFFAGTYINYYYYGLYIVGILIKLTGIRPTTAFNLAVPMIAALTAVNVFSLAYNLSLRQNRTGRIYSLRAIGSGLLAVLFVIFFSNLEGMGQLLQHLANVSTSTFQSAIPGLTTLIRSIQGVFEVTDGASLQPYRYWDVSRIIPYTINEFPYWSFLFADLHPHIMVLPFSILYLNLAYNWLKSVGQSHLWPEEAQEPRHEQWGEIIQRESKDILPRLTWASLTRWLAFPLVLGVLATINTWDLPTYLGIMTATFIIARYRATLHPLTWLKVGLLLLETAIFTGALLSASILLYLPFYQHYKAATDIGIGLVKDLIPLDQHLKLWGFFLYILALWLWLTLRNPQTQFAPLRAIALFIHHWSVLPHLTQIYRVYVTQATKGYRNVLISVGLVMLIIIALLLLKMVSLAFTLLGVTITLLLLLRWDSSIEQSFVGLLAFTGFLLLLGVQVIYIRDFLGGAEYYRMNTYFKYFIQIWVLFSIAAGVILPQLWEQSQTWSNASRWAWQGLTSLLILSSLVFFVLGTQSRLNDRFPGARPDKLTLDGMAYMTVGQFTWQNVTYTLSHDYEALNWLIDHIHGAPIVAEAKIGYYREWGMRVAAYTGLPSILGGLHQNEQHPPEQLGQRDTLVRQFWATTDVETLLDLINQLDIQYIYIGQLERTIYGQDINDRFENLMAQGYITLAFSNAETKIYQVSR